VGRHPKFIGGHRARPSHCQSSDLALSPLPLPLAIATTSAPPRPRPLPLAIASRFRLLHLPRTTTAVGFGAAPPWPGGMKRLWKQSGGLACADAGPLSPLGGRSRRRARLTLYAVAFAAFTPTPPPLRGRWCLVVRRSVRVHGAVPLADFQPLLVHLARARARALSRAAARHVSPATSPSVHGTAAKVVESSVVGQISSREVEAEP
jgi:hypothetical protein